MKFTGILASLAVASTATAAALPNLDVVKIQNTVTRVDGVLSKIESGVSQGDVGNVLTEVEGDLTGVHKLLNGLVGGVLGAVEDTGLVSGVLDLAGGLVTSVTGLVKPVLNVEGVVPDFGTLSKSVVERVQSGDIDAAGLQNLLTVVGGDSGLASLNKIVSQANQAA